MSRPQPYANIEGIPPPAFFRMWQCTNSSSSRNDNNGSGSRTELVVEATYLGDLTNTMCKCMDAMVGHERHVHWWVMPMQSHMQRRCCLKNDVWDDLNVEFMDPRFVSHWVMSSHCYHVLMLIQHWSWPSSLAPVMRQFLQATSKEIEWRLQPRLFDDGTLFIETLSFELRVLWCGSEDDDRKAQTVFYCRDLHDCVILMERQLLRPGYVLFRLEQWEHNRETWSWEPVRYA